MGSWTVIAPDLNRFTTHNRTSGFSLLPSLAAHQDVSSQSLVWTLRVLLNDEAIDGKVATRAGAGQSVYMFAVQRRYEGSTGFPFIFIYPQTNVFIRYEEGTLTFYYNCWLVLPAMISKLGRKLSEVNCKVTPRLQVTVSHWRRWWCLTRSLCIISIISVVSC